MFFIILIMYITIYNDLRLKNTADIFKYNPFIILSLVHIIKRRFTLME